MIKRKSRNIEEFTKGDIITRVAPAVFKYSKINHNRGLTQTEEYSCSWFMNLPLKYIGIRNGKIIVDILEEGNFEKQKDIARLPYKDFKEGWGNYNLLPSNCEKDFEITIENILTESFISN